MNVVALVVAALCGVIAAVLAGVVTQAVVEPSHPVRRFLIIAVVGAFTATAVAIIATNLVNSSSTPPIAESPAQNSPASSVSAQPTAVPDTKEPMATSLLDLNYVEEDTNRDIDLDEEDSISIGGSTYGRVLTYSCSLYCNGDSPQTRTFVLGGQYSTFTADLAVLDSAAGTYRVDITLDSSSPQTFTVEAGVPAKLSLPVGGVQRMRIQMYAPGELKSPVQAGADTTQGENGGGLPGIGLADPLLLP